MSRIHKQKSKLIKLKNDKNKNTYITTKEDCIKWSRIINREIFNNQLAEIDNIEIGWRRKCWAYYVYDVNKKGEKYIKLAMNKKYPSKLFFVEVLAHELIHHYQFLFGDPVGHGPSFSDWTDKFNKRGLNLV